MADWNLKDKAAIAGAGNSAYGRRLIRSPIDLAADAIANALDDAGLRRDDLDGLIVSFGSPIGADGDTLAQLLGLKLRSYNQTWAHGRFTASCIQWAAMMVNAGFADAVACLASELLRHPASEVRRLRRPRRRARSGWRSWRGSGLRHDLAGSRRRAGGAPLLRALQRRQPPARRGAGRLSQARVDESDCDHARAVRPSRIIKPRASSASRCICSTIA